MFDNPDKAYVLGLFAGGGIIQDRRFSIVLPFKKWGTDPERMREISQDILGEINLKFKNCYGINLDYEIGNERWTIVPLDNTLPGLSAIIEDLRSLGLPGSGVLINSADLTVCKQKLKDLLAQKFLSGIFDTRASLTESHRRFTDDYPVVSIEIPGSTRNFLLAVQLCSWMTSFGSVTDQILFNHPCQHCSWDSFYSGWKKGFKIRFLANSFIANHSFALKAKAYDATQLRYRQRGQEQIKCLERVPDIKPISIHKDINHSSLPPEVRGKLFFHYLHVCATMGCPYAPLEKIREFVRGCEEFVALNAICHKEQDSVECLELLKKLCSEEFPNSYLCKKEMLCSDFLSLFPNTKYPGSEDGVAFLFAPELKGKRTKGFRSDIIKSALRESIEVWCIFTKDFEQESGILLEESKPVVITNKVNNRGVLLSPIGVDSVRKKIQIEGIDVIVR